MSLWEQKSWAGQAVESTAALRWHKCCDSCRAGIPQGAAFCWTGREGQTQTWVPLCAEDGLVGRGAWGCLMQPVSGARVLLAGCYDGEGQVKVFQQVVPGKTSAGTHPTKHKARRDLPAQR